MEQGRRVTAPWPSRPSHRAHLATELESSWKPRSWEGSSETFRMGLALAKDGWQVSDGAVGSAPGSRVPQAGGV